MNLSHPLNKANETACTSASDPLSCHCDKLVSACVWSSSDVDVAKCSSDHAGCRMKCDVDVKAKVDAMPVPEGEIASSYLSRMLDRVKRSVVRYTDDDYTEDGMRAQDTYSSCKRVCDMNKSSCEIGDVFGKVRMGTWSPEGCMDAASELSDPRKNGGRAINSFDDLCAAKIASKKT